MLEISLNNFWWLLKHFKNKEGENGNRQIYVISF